MDLGVPREHYGLFVYQHELFQASKVLPFVQGFYYYGSLPVGSKDFIIMALSQ